jgi:hypothetical protein
MSDHIVEDWGDEKTPFKFAAMQPVEHQPGKSWIADHLWEKAGGHVGFYGWCEPRTTGSRTKPFLVFWTCNNDLGVTSTMRVSHRATLQIWRSRKRRTNSAAILHEHRPAGDRSRWRAGQHLAEIDPLRFGSKRPSYSKSYNYHIL